MFVLKEFVSFEILLLATIAHWFCKLCDYLQIPTSPWKVTTHDMQTNQYKHLLVPAVGPAFIYISSVLSLKGNLIQQVVM